MFPVGHELSFCIPGKGIRHIQILHFQTFSPSNISPHHISLHSSTDTSFVTCLNVLCSNPLCFRFVVPVFSVRSPLCASVSVSDVSFVLSFCVFCGLLQVKSGPVTFTNER
jgi:hypothetical protein